MKGYVYQRGKTYTYVVDIGKNPKTGERKQKSKGGFARKKDAQAALRKLLVEIDENRYVEPSKELFSTFITNWFNNHYQYRVKDTTVTSRRYLMDKHLIDENPFANKSLSTITTFDIDTLYNLKIDQEYSASYIRKMHQMLNRALNQAIKWGKISNNPVNNSEPPSVKKEEIRIWSYDNIHQFLSGVKEERYYIVFLLAVYTGMRRGEILGLKWEDIDFENQVIKVKRTLTYVPKVGYKLTTPKTLQSKREIPFSNLVRNELVSLKKKQDEWKERLKDAYENKSLVVSTDIGRYQDPRNILRVMNRICNSTNIPRIRFHDLRHTHASILLSNNVDIVKVSARLGHANPRVTLEIYAHLLPNNQDEVADIFEDALQKNKKR